MAKARKNPARKRAPATPAARGGSSPRSRSTDAARASRRTRLDPEARRRQILDIAARALAEEQGTLEITRVAELARVTRPVIYRLFPTRQALLEAVVEDFEHELSARFREALVQSLGRPFDEITVRFVDAVCDAVEAKGRGPWNLLDARTDDPEAGRIGRAMNARFLAPWMERLADLTDRSQDDVATVAHVVVAAGRAALDGWLDGRVSREDAARDATRAVAALLLAFAAR